jgi:hypothetical protein
MCPLKRKRERFAEIGFVKVTYFAASFDEAVFCKGSSLILRSKLSKANLTCSKGSGMSPGRDMNGKIPPQVEASKRV